MQCDDKSTEQRKLEKQSYAKPRLVEYGTVAKLTQDATGSMTDGNPSAPSMMVGCL